MVRPMTPRNDKRQSGRAVALGLFFASAWYAAFLASNATLASVMGSRGKNGRDSPSPDPHPCPTLTTGQSGEEQRGRGGDTLALDREGEARKVWPAVLPNAGRSAGARAENKGVGARLAERYYAVVEVVHVVRLRPPFGQPSRTAWNRGTLPQDPMRSSCALRLLI